MGDVCERLNGQLERLNGSFHDNLKAVNAKGQGEFWNLTRNTLALKLALSAMEEEALRFKEELKLEDYELKFEEVRDSRIKLEACFFRRNAETILPG
jgi:hypothetical protein